MRLNSSHTVAQTVRPHISCTASQQMHPQEPTPPSECDDRSDATPQHHRDGDTDRDWTENLPKSDFVRFFREKDWSKSTLGPLKEWSPVLQLFTRIVLADSRAACLWWGPGLVAIYNELYMPLSGHAHPNLMGAKFRESCPELWESIKPYFERVRNTGIGADYITTVPLLVMRHGWREEKFFAGNFVPVPGNGPANQPDGFYNSLFEVTNQRLTERRTAMLNRMANVPELTPTAVCPHILETLETNAEDIPLAILYEVDHSTRATKLLLRGHYGLPKGHNLIVDGAEITSREGLVPDCHSAGSNMVMIEYDDRFASASWRGFGSPSRRIAILPITGGSRIFGYLIIGTNPCRPSDDDICTQFQNDIRRMASAIITAAVNAKESNNRQHQLEADLELSDTKLRHLIEHASVGMVHMTVEGNMLWANEQYYTLHGLPADQIVGKLGFFEMYTDEDRHKAEEAWDALKNGANHVTIELRLKRFYTTPLGSNEPACIQVLAFPYRENGKTTSIMAATTDISRLKWAQEFQARLAAEAREAKRQQEAFIDVVSHEMRNPLSAIVHCADEITRSFEECQSKVGEIPEVYHSLLKENADSANVIMQCAHHQKRIIDDVLTLSKLDQMMLTVTPVATRPLTLVHDIVSMFEAELKSHHIRYDVDSDTSLSQLHIDQLNIDPSRVTQVFINLITNAIKFMKNSKNPSISIHYGVATSNPRGFFPADMYWATKNPNSTDMTNNPDWGTGEVIYLMFLVQDSGIGMSTKEIHKIFERFRQANARTHVTYGGSGLGLFISKELCEKQGGEIGVFSAPGKGSTFGFYVKTRRVATKPPPTNSTEAVGENQPQLHVLLVEDNLINQQLVVKQLRRAGCVVDVANDGAEALQILEKKEFDVVLMDLEMPVMDGLTAMQEIRKRQKEAKLAEHIPIIAVTANVRQEQMDTALAAGADRVMQKPFKAVDLVYMMKGLVPQVATPVSERPTPGLSGPMHGILL